MKKKSHDRAKDSDMLGVSMSKDLKERIRAAAAKEHRPMANWCAYHLERILDEMDAETASKTAALPAPNPGLQPLEAPKSFPSSRVTGATGAKASQ